MSFEKKVTFLAQGQSGECFQDGVMQSEHASLGIDAQQGLMALATGRSKHSDDALTSVNILLDDMRTNFAVQGEAGWNGGLSRAAMCMLESLDNINEYLQQSAEQSAVDMIAVQLTSDRFSLVCVGGYQCLVVRKEQFKCLLDESTQPRLLGQAQSVSAASMDQPLSAGDMIALIHDEDVTGIGLDFIRVTLSRFTDNPETVLRQLNTRGARQGMSHKPALVMVRINEIQPRKRGWLGKFGKS